jgi:hypothetical protein
MVGFWPRIPAEPARDGSKPKDHRGTTDTLQRLRIPADTGIHEMGDTGLENERGGRFGCRRPCLLDLGALRSPEICSERNHERNHGAHPRHRLCVHG